MCLRNGKLLVIAKAGETLLLVEVMFILVGGIWLLSSEIPAHLKYKNIFISNCIRFYKKRINFPLHLQIFGFLQHKPQLLFELGTFTDWPKRQANPENLDVVMFVCKTEIKVVHTHTHTHSHTDTFGITFRMYRRKLCTIFAEWIVADYVVTYSYTRTLLIQVANMYRQTEPTTIPIKWNQTKKKHIVECEIASPKEEKKRQTHTQCDSGHT